MCTASSSLSILISSTYALPHHLSLLSISYRARFLGMIYGLYALSYLLWGVLYRTLVKRQRKLALKTQAKGQGANGCRDEGKSKEELERETTI